MGYEAFLKEKCEYISEETAEAFAAYCGERITTTTQAAHYARLLARLCGYQKCDYRVLKEAGIRECLAERQKKIAPRTFTGELAALRSLAAYLDWRLGTSVFGCLAGIKAEPLVTSLKKEALPTTEELDQLLELLEGDPALTTAILLAVRCSLGITDIAALRKKMFIVDKNGHVGLLPNEHSTGFIRVPDDVVAKLSDYLEELPDTLGNGDGWLFPSERRNTHATPRSLQLYLKEACEEIGLEKNITFRSLRSLGIVDMLRGGAGYKRVAEYVSSLERNLSYYGRVLPELEDSAVEFSKIRIL